MTAGGDSAAGSIGGVKSPENIKVSSGGAATQSIPIVVPPGTAGVQPNLSFTYNSQGENSLLGLGWSVSGLPVIHRCPRTVAQDGFRGALNYDTNDRFCLDGQRLMVISGTYGAANAEYRTEVDSFLKIVSYGNAGGGPAYFVVKTKGGETMEFGGNASSDQGRIEAQGKSAVRVWALSKLSDVKGNHFTVTYAEDGTNGEYRPTQIDYTINATAGIAATRKVVFAYDENGVNRADKIPQWVGGSKILTTKLLTSVKTYAPPPGSSTPVLVRDYRVEYETGSATVRSRVKRIKECDAAGNCLPANTPGSQAAWQFTWQEGGNGAFQYESGATYSTADLNATHVNTGDFNNDGKMDFITFPGSQIYTWLSNGDGTFQKIAVSYTPSQMNINNIWIADVNGDGNDDFITYETNLLYTYISLGNGQYQTPVSQTISAPQFDRLKTWVGDFNGDGRIDLISYQNLKFYTYFSNGNGTYQVQSSANISTNGLNWGFFAVGDFNGDGKTDLVTFANGSIWTYFANGDGTLQVTSVTKVGNPGRIYAGDLNADGRADIFGFTGNTDIQVYLSKSDGNYNYYDYVIPVTISIDINIETPQLGDFNGDGKMDVVVSDQCEGGACTEGNFTTFLSKGDGTFTVLQQAISPSLPGYDPSLFLFYWSETLAATARRKSQRSSKVLSTGI